MPRLGGSQTSQSYLISKRNSMSTLPTTNEHAPAPASGNGVTSALRQTAQGMNGLLSPRVTRTISKGKIGSVAGFSSDSDQVGKRSTLRAAEGGKGSLLPDFNAAASTPKAERIRRQPPSRSKSTGATLGLSMGGLRSSLSSRGSQQGLPQTQADLKSSGGSGSTFSALRRRTATVSDDELDSHSVSSNKRDYRTDSDAFYRSTNRRSALSSQNGSPRNGVSLWGMSQHGNYTAWNKLGRMKLGNILQVIIVLAVTALVWESHHKALFAAQQLTQFKEEESLLCVRP